MVLLDMKIPKNCWDCPMQRYAVRSDNHICVITGKLAEEIEERSALCPIKTEIPKDATNGDVIKAMFPRAKTWIEHLPEMQLDVMRFDLEDSEMLDCFNLEWWNAPYRREE